MAQAGVSTLATSTAWASCVDKLSSGAAPAPAEVSALCSSELVEALATLAYGQCEAALEQQHIRAFWDALLVCQQSQQQIGAFGGLLAALQDLAAAADQQSRQLSHFAQQMLLGLAQHAREQHATPGAQQRAALEGVPAGTVALLAGLCHKHRTAVTSLLMATAPLSLPGLLQQFYAHKLQQLCDAVEQAEAQQASGSEDEGAAAADDDEMAAADADCAAADAMSEGSEGEQQQQQQQQQEQSGSESPAGLPGGAGGGRPGVAAAAAGVDAHALLGAAWAAELSAAAQCLEDLGLNAAAEEAYTHVINSYVVRRLRSLAGGGDFSVAVLPLAQRLVCAGPLAFLRLVLGRGSEAPLKLQEWHLRLTYLTLETLGALRARDMFDIVIDYPDSCPSLRDLALCLQHTSAAAAFAATFATALAQRLLHAGAATADIIATYVSTLRAMAHVDKSGLLLEAVSEPIRAYLRARPDTIRCVVSLLTEGPGDGSGSGGLLEELQQQQGQQGQGQGRLGAGGAAGGSCGGGSGPPGQQRYNWVTSEAEGDESALRLLEALEAGPEAAAEQAAVQQAGMLGLPVRPAAPSAALLGGGGGGSRADASGDVVAALIGIYGGPLLFMEEYQKLLSARLLAKDGYDADAEVRTLELLKIRFGEAGLHACEVMLRDLGDSKRLHANIAALSSPPAAAAASAASNQQAQQALPPRVSDALARLRATIASHLFWPDLPEHQLTLPPDLQAALEVYARRFHHLKAPRKLTWRPSLGVVELSVTVGDSGPLDFRVTPVHATLLLQFADGSPAAAAAAAAGGGDGGGSGSLVLSASQLAAAMGVPVPVVRRHALFWVAAGVLLERRGPGGEALYSRATRLDPSSIVSREETTSSWADAPGDRSGACDRLVTEMGPFENYITGLLTNMGPMPLERLHNVLRAFVVSEPRYEGRTQDQLAAFLAHMAEAGRVAMAGGLYSRPRPADGGA